MTTLPTYKGARVVAHTTDDTARHVFEYDGTAHLSWRDMDRQDTAPYPLWRFPSELLDPVPVPHDPKTGEYLYYVSADTTIPVGATCYRTAPTGFFTGPFEQNYPYTPMMRFSAPHTFWTVDPIPDPDPEPEPGPEKVAGPGWWDVLTDDQRDRLEGLSGEQAGLVADLIQPATHILALLDITFERTSL